MLWSVVLEDSEGRTETKDVDITTEQIEGYLLYIAKRREKAKAKAIENPNLIICETNKHVTKCRFKARGFDAYTREKILLDLVYEKIKDIDRPCFEKALIAIQNENIEDFVEYSKRHENMKNIREKIPKILQCKNIRFNYLYYIIRTYRSTFKKLSYRIFKHLNLNQKTTLLEKYSSKITDLNFFT